MGLLEDRETEARVRVEELQVEADRILAELGEAETVLERRVIARGELAEALAAPAVADDVLTLGPQDPQSVPVPVSVPVVRVPVARSVVPRRHDGMSVEALAPDYRRIMEVLEADSTAGEEGLSAKELTGRLGLKLVPAKIEGVRCKAKRLLERDWLAPEPSGRFRLRPSGVPG